MTLVSHRQFARLAAIGVASAMALGMFAGTASAATPMTLYVSKEHASDANPCSATMPCLTIGHAISMAGAGATIRVDEGTYAGAGLRDQEAEPRWGEGRHRRHRPEGRHPAARRHGHRRLRPAHLRLLRLRHTWEQKINRLRRSRTLSRRRDHRRGHVESDTSPHNVIRHDDAGFDTTLTLGLPARGHPVRLRRRSPPLLSVAWSPRQRATSNREQRRRDPRHRRGRAERPQRHLLERREEQRPELRRRPLPSAPRRPGHVPTPTKGGMYDNVVTRQLSRWATAAPASACSPRSRAPPPTTTPVSLQRAQEQRRSRRRHPRPCPRPERVRQRRSSATGSPATASIPDSGSGHPTGIAIFSAVVPVTVDGGRQPRLQRVLGPLQGRDRSPSTASRPTTTRAR